ncbi:MAG: deoxyribonuclease V [Defluviicoccus sp.]|nr:MAG: deoxyribonuclease V [Defluviicoccus sp.]
MLPLGSHPTQAIALQRHVAAAVEREDRLPEPIRTVAGIDVSYGARGRATRARGAAVLLDAQTLEVLDQATVECATTFPYIPGLLTFREAPVAITALEALSARPDLIVCDGQGIAHPRRCGVASHLGLALDLPSIGAAKSRLTGFCDEPGLARGSCSPLLDNTEVIGACLRTRTGVAPMWISIGHRVSLASAIRLVLQFAPRFRMPEPTRLADRLSKARA